LESDCHTTVTQRRHDAAVEIVAILLATAALVVSGASLYSTALRGADVGIDRVEWGGDWASDQENFLPKRERVILCLFISNTGAQGGLLEHVTIGRVEYLGNPPRLWKGISGTILSDDPRGETGTETPIALKAGDARTKYLLGFLEAADDEGEYARQDSPLRAYAERLRGFRGLRVEVIWTYRRAAGGWRSLLPEQKQRRWMDGRVLTSEPRKGGRRREIVTARTMVEIDPKAAHEMGRIAWNENPAGALDVLKNRAPAQSDS